MVKIKKALFKIAHKTLKLRKDLYMAYLGNEAN